MNIKGSFTVEASILVPLLIILSATMIYLGIYNYDRILMIQDVNSLVTVLRDSGFSNGQSKGEICRLASEEIAEHPYLSIENLKVDFKEDSDTITVKISGDWKMPIFANKDKTISYEQKTRQLNPIDVVYQTEAILYLMKETK